MASVTRTKLRNAIAEALWDYVSATQLSDVCDDLRMPPAPADVHPMSSKRQYVHSRTKTYEMTQLVATAREVVLDYPHEDLVALLAELDGTSGGVRGELKNIIFAAVGAKPKIVLRDALNNDVDIVEGALVYDAPLGEEGLSWRSLVHWSAQRDGVMVTDANERELAVALFNRLARSVGSEPELLMLRTNAAFYREHGFDLPALMPQVYLHYDPYSAAQIGGKPRLFRQRMDFLMLLPRRVRVVVEIDGKQHYSNEDGTANPARYAVMVREDRQLRLAAMRSTASADTSSLKIKTRRRCFELSTPSCSPATVLSRSRTDTDSPHHRDARGLICGTDAGPCRGSRGRVRPAHLSSATGSNWRAGERCCDPRPS